jgi:nicotinamidase/pyrazinamidase
VQPRQRLENRVAVATQDWHPPGHVSFASAHPGRAPFERIELYGREQVLWPDHCVQDTPGAALAPNLPWASVSAVIRKGTDPAVDSYSGFRNNYDAHGQRPPTGLAGYLRERGIRAIFVCGLARDFCVRWTAEDGVDLGFETTILWDLTRSVDPSGDAALRDECTRRGIRLVDSADAF